jgi:hypothetical protein
MLEPIEYCFICDFDGDGEICRAPSNEALWRFKTQRKRGFFQLLPDFSLCDAAGKELLTVRCQRRYLRPRFVMIANGLSVCTIIQRRLLVKKYTLEFNTGEKWIFHMPLFTVFYRALSASGEIRVGMFRHDTWYLLFPHGLDDLYLIAAIAFIHREQQRSSLPRSAFLLAILRSLQTIRK